MNFVSITSCHKLKQSSTFCHLTVAVEMIRFSHTHVSVTKRKAHADCVQPGCLYYKQIIVRGKVRVEHQIKPIDWYELC